MPHAEPDRDERGPPPSLSRGNDPAMGNSTAKKRINATPRLMQEIVEGGGVGVSELAKGMSGRGGRPTAPSTVHRWIFGGSNVEGRRIKLEAARIGGRIVSTKEALRRYLNALNGIEETPASPARSEPPAPSTATRRKQVADAMAELAEAGA